MKFRWSRVLVGLFCLLLAFFVVRPALACDTVEQCEEEIKKITQDLNLSIQATTPLESEVKKLDSRLKSIQSSIVQLNAEQKKKGLEIEAQESVLADQYRLFQNRIDQQYRYSRTFSPLVVLLTSARSSDGSHTLKYALTLAERDKQSIDSIGQNILDLQRAKADAAAKAKQLAGLQAELDKQLAFFEKEIAGAKKYQQDLKGQIAALSAEQQSILNARSGTFTTSVGNVAPADDFNASIEFKANAPSSSFAVFSFGAYTHRNGMSQYGAKNQAESGRNYKDIIQWYYGHGVKKDDGMPDTINVANHGEMSFQKYLYGLGEMPDTFHFEALKAQAVAARTYAKRATKPICTDEKCQVFYKSKSDNPPELWKKAVDETEKEIIDGDVSAQYASSHGGFTNTTGWDTTDRSGNGDWSSRAWETKGKGPWFYKSWYRDGYWSTGANCGRNHPWLNQEEFSDIVNAWIVRKNPNGADTNRIQPVTINTCNIGGKGGNPYSMEELRNFANNSGGAVTKVNSVGVTHNNNGQTTNVVLQTNRGEINIPGSEFKQTYNIRAPGYLRVPQSSFAFFNIEHKP